MSQIWWNQVTNAVRYVSEITDSLLDEKSILIKHTSSMPWKNDFEDCVRNTISEQNSDKRFEDILPTDNPGDYLLNEFCKKEKRATFRPSKGYAKFLAESDDIVLHDRYLWVQIENLDSLEKWTNFVSEYIQERGKRTKAVFVLDVASDINVSSKRGVKQYFLGDYIGEYDRIVFAVLAASEINECSFIKSYLSELVANICGNDIELCNQCISQHVKFMCEPYALIKQICTDLSRSDGQPFAFSLSDEEVDHLIWQSQIKTIYPYIEEYREEFVRKYSKDIDLQLPISASYGEVYNDPNDVELGTLKYMADNNLIRLSSAEYEKLKRFKNARNKLSHLTYLTMEEIKAII